MNQLELERILTRIFTNSPGRTRGMRSSIKCLGVFPADHQPCVEEISRNIPCCYVMNTDGCVDPGTHWVAFFHPSQNILEFFDSFGRAPTELGFAIPNTSSVLYNKYPVQAEMSILCGELCTIYLYFRAQGYPFKELISHLSSKSDKEFKTIFLKVVEGIK